MLKKLRGKIHLLKSHGVSLEIGPEEKPFEQAKSIKVITKNSTTSASIVPEVWIMLGLLSSLGIKIAYDSQKDHK